MPYCSISISYFLAHQILKEGKRTGRTTIYLDYLKENPLIPIIHSHIMTCINMQF